MLVHNMITVNAGLIIAVEFFPVCQLYNTLPILFEENIKTENTLLI